MAEGPPRFFTKPEEYVGVRHHRRTLFLDMDETLVHCFLARPAFFEDASDSFFKFTLEDDPSLTYYAFKRPGLNEFLRRCAEHYEMRILTAGEDVYARTLLRWLLPANMIDESRWYTRSCCVFDESGLLVKNLTEVSGFRFDERNTILLDDSAPNNAIPPHNAVSIPRFAPLAGRSDEDNYKRMRDDRGLEKIANMLCGDNFTRSEDIRVPIARFYELIRNYCSMNANR